MVAFDASNGPPVTGGNDGRAPSPLHPYSFSIIYFKWEIVETITINREKKRIE